MMQTPFYMERLCWENEILDVFYLETLPAKLTLNFVLELSRLSKNYCIFKLYKYFTGTQMQQDYATYFTI